MKGLGTAKKTEKQETSKPSRLEKNIDNLMANKRFSTREQLPKTRIFNGHHPIDFESDVLAFMQKYKRLEGRRVMSQGEMIELAFYELRQKLTDEPIPDWVTQISTT